MRVMTFLICERPTTKIIEKRKTLTNSVITAKEKYFLTFTTTYYEKLPLPS
jgi:hypothetical protein